MKTSIVPLTILGSCLFILAGCQGDTSKEETAADSTQESRISGTGQYGRGAKSDGKDTNADEEPVKELTSEANSIVIYFSRSGNTENLANYIQQESQSDILELELTNPYPADYEETVERADNERENEAFPEIKTAIPDLNQYDKIYLGYQTWSMTLSNPMISFLLAYGNQLANKEVFPFSTNAGYGEGDSLQRIQELAPNATLRESYAVEDKDVENEATAVDRWIQQTK